jgi:hypothetical protein
MTPEQQLEKLGITLPPASGATGVFKVVYVDGKHCYVSGHGPVRLDGTMITGKVGEALSVEEGKDAARQTGLAILASLRAHFGSLDKVKRVIKVLGMVNCPADFASQPQVINGCSELFRDIWGDDLGLGVRSAVGMGSLPGQISVEVEALFEIH